MDHHCFDVIIVGSGAAGLTAALELSEKLKVAIISKSSLSEGSTRYAQGGIAAVLDTEDSIDSHIKDTLIAGGDLCDPKAVRFVVEHASLSIEKLIQQGVQFTRTTDKELHLTKEGGHSHRRIIHAADASGLAVESTLVFKARQNKNIRIFEDLLVIDLIRERNILGQNGRCRGLYCFDPTKQNVYLFQAKAIVLATGGASRVYLYSTNPDGCTGDGIAMAWRAGCRIANMEFMQFHPTCLYHPQAKNFLITEAVRGEGGRLLIPETGERFMLNFDERGELAPRDIVARAIDHEMKRLGLDFVNLDISHQPEDFIKEHFPTIYTTCLSYGIDITKEPIPVVPAAHYTCGGVMTDLNGRTDVPGLYAIGEVAFTGLHGANRLASNSLLECLVFASSLSNNILSNFHKFPDFIALNEWDESWVSDSDEEVVVSHNWEELRRFMWDYVGIVRTTKRLERAQHRIKMLLAEIDDYYGSFRVSHDLLELRNLAVVAQLIIDSALLRKESRGLHYTLDFPYSDQIAAPQNTILIPPNFEPMSPD
jgi:L-aspartate oxidase